MKVFGSVTLSEGSDVKNLTVDHGNNYPSLPNEGELFYHSSNGLSVYTGTQWVSVQSQQPQLITLTGDVTGSGSTSIALTLANSGVTAGTYDSVTVDAKGRVISGTTGSESVISSLGYTPLNKAGDTILGSLKFPSTAGIGIFPGNTYGWRDLLGDISGKNSGGQAPTQNTFMPGVRGWAYAAGDMGDLTFHLPHDYAPGTDLFLHFHWSHNGTNISGNFVVTCNITYAKGHQQNSFSTAISTLLTVPNLNITNTPRYFHRVDEMQISTNGGGTNLLDSSKFEVDGIILVSFTLSTIPSISGGAPNSPYVLSADLHYQSTGISTKNKSPNFYN